jgi:hypothetical protein
MAADPEIPHARASGFILPIPAKSGFPDFPKSRPNRNRGKIPKIFPILAQSGSGKSRPIFPAFGDFGVWLWACSIVKIASPQRAGVVAFIKKGQVSSGLLLSGQITETQAAAVTAAAYDPHRAP